MYATFVSQMHGDEIAKARETRDWARRQLMVLCDEA